MKLHLPKMLLTAVLATFSLAFADTVTTTYVSGTSGVTINNGSFVRQDGSTDGPASFTGTINLANLSTTTDLVISGNNGGTISNVSTNGGWGGRVAFNNSSDSLETVVLNKGVEANVTNIQAKNNLTVKSDNASFYGDTNNYTFNIVVGENGVRMNGGSSNNYKMTGSLSGTGNFYSCTGNNSTSLTLTGDVSAFTGSFVGSTDGGKQRAIIFGDGSASTATQGVIGGGVGTATAVTRAVTFNYTGDLAVNGSLYATTATATNLTNLTLDKGGAISTLNMGTTNLTVGSDAELTVGTLVLDGGSLVNNGTLTLNTSTTLGEGSTLVVEDGATLNLNGTVNAHSTNGTLTERTQDQGNGYGYAELTATIGSGTWNIGEVTWQMNDRSGATYDDATHTLSYTGESNEYWFYSATGEGSTIDAAAQATKITVDTHDSENAIAFGNADRGEIALDIKSGLVTVTGNNNAPGFVTGEVSIGAGGTLQLQGHDALGYNEGSVTATPGITMQGDTDNKAVLDSQDTGKLTFSTDLTLKGHTEVKGNALKVYGMKLTATGTDNTVSNNLTLDRALTVDVTGAGDTLVLDGNIGGGNAMTVTGAGSLTVNGDTGVSITNNGTGSVTLKDNTISGGTLKNTGSGSVTLDGSTISGQTYLQNTGSGSVELKNLAINERLDLQSTASYTMTGGTTSTSTSYTLIVGDGSSSTSVTMTDGTYNIGNSTAGIGKNATITVAKDAVLTGKSIKNSGYVDRNGTLTIEGDSTDKGSVTMSGETFVSTLNNAGTASFNTFSAENVNLTGNSTTTFGGTTNITKKLNVADTATANVTGTLAASNVALSGTLNLAQESITINTLTLNAGSVIDVDDASGQLTTSAMTVNGDTTINADLVIANGSTVTFNDGAVTLNGTLTIGEGSTIALGTAYHDALEANGQVLVFKGVTNQIDASILESIVVTGDFLPGHLLSVAAGDGTYNIYATPEPATATLSLLALAGLMARRRRH